MLFLLLSCVPNGIDLGVDDLHGLHWEGDFRWASETADEPTGLVEFDLNEEEDGTYTGEFRYTGSDTTLVYAVEARTFGAMLTITQTEVFEAEDLGNRTACLGEYLLAYDGETLSGEYFPQNEACLNDTGIATFHID